LTTALPQHSSPPQLWDSPQLLASKAVPEMKVLEMKSGHQMEVRWEANMFTEKISCCHGQFLFFLSENFFLVLPP